MASTPSLSPSSSSPMASSTSPSPFSSSPPLSSHPSSMSYGYSLSRDGGASAAIQDLPGGVAPWAQMGGPPPPSASPSAASTASVPQAREIPLLSPPIRVQVPQKWITGKAEMEKFMRSEALSMFLGFVVNLSNSVQGHKLSDECHVSDFVSSLISIIETMSTWVDEIPPSATAVRYGNPSFRVWQGRLQKEGPALVERILPESLTETVTELYPYFADSFGNATRIDYGTGHEANFAAFLLCLARLGLIRREDYQAVVTRVFVNYLSLMRKLQTTYWLEPAGSHGVWGLDDYHFLPFVFGSSQLIGHKYMKPKSIQNDDVLENFSSEYLYFSCISFIKKVKKGPLAEHSPMLNDISGVPTWQKVNSGMLKMYRAECLEKIPIMQHFLFGTIIPRPL